MKVLFWFMIFYVFVCMYGVFHHFLPWHEISVVNTIIEALETSSVKM